MKLFAQTIILIASIALPTLGFGQDFKVNLFLRTPQIVNFNFSNSKTAYTPLLSTGAGISHKAKFLELGTYMTHEDYYGFYTFFGTTLKSKSLTTSLNLHTNWFGEITYVRKQQENSDFYIYTSGICVILNRGFAWGSIGIPLCFGLAYGQGSYNLNTRTMLNISFNLN